MIRVSVKLFGPQAILVGSDRVELAMPGEATCEDLMRALADAAPALAKTLPTSRIAINHAYAENQDAVREGDEVALIGMVSGG